MNRSLWKFLTSLRVTIVLLGLAIVLVFVGTVAQADEGLYQVQNRYFRQRLGIEGLLLKAYSIELAHPQFAVVTPVAIMSFAT